MRNNFNFFLLQTFQYSMQNLSLRKKSKNKVVVMNNMKISAKSRIHCHSSIKRSKHSSSSTQKTSLTKMYKIVPRTFVSMSFTSYIMLIFLLVLCSTPSTISSRSQESHETFHRNNKHNGKLHNISKHKHHSTSHNNQGKKISNF